MHKVHELNFWWLEMCDFFGWINVLNRKNQYKVSRLEKEKLLAGSVCNKTNTGDGGKARIWGDISSFGATNAKIYTESMNEELDFDVLQNEVKQFLAKLQRKRKWCLNKIWLRVTHQISSRKN